MWATKAIEELLALEPRGVLSLVGGGGKTSLMFHLARRLAQTGRRVLTTTTTRILVPTPEQSKHLIVSADPGKVLEEAFHLRATSFHLTAAAARLDEPEKLQGFAPEAIGDFEASGLFDWIIVEADGAARRPLKAPASHEPVIPAQTSVLLAVAGLEVIGAPFSEDLVFRSHLAGPLMKLADGEPITERSLALLFADPSGSFKGAPASARRFIFLNKADTPARRAAGARVADEIRQLTPAPAEAVLVGQALTGIRVHGFYPLEVTR